MHVCTYACMYLTHEGATQNPDIGYNWMIEWMNGWMNSMRIPTSKLPAHPFLSTILITFPIPSIHHSKPLNFFIHPKAQTSYLTSSYNTLASYLLCPILLHPHFVLPLERNEKRDSKKHIASCPLGIMLIVSSIPYHSMIYSRYFALFCV